MITLTLYHNPRCSKSRQTLALLRENGVEPTIVEYLKDPPSQAELTSILQKLGKTPEELVRLKDFQKLGLVEVTTKREKIAQLAANPQIMERPILVGKSKAVIGRPPEAVLELINR